MDEIFIKTLFPEVSLNKFFITLNKINPNLLFITNFVYFFVQIASISSVRLIRDKEKRTLLGYGFLEFPNYEIAEKVLMKSIKIPGTQRSFTLKWCSDSHKSGQNGGGPG